MLNILRNKIDCYVEDKPNGLHVNHESSKDEVDYKKLYEEEKIKREQLEKNRNVM